jgi:hypothetical protein
MPTFFANFSYHGWFFSLGQYFFFMIPMLKLRNLDWKDFWNYKLNATKQWSSKIIRVVETSHKSAVKFLLDYILEIPGTQRLSTLPTKTFFCKDVVVCWQNHGLLKQFTKGIICKLYPTVTILVTALSIFSVYIRYFLQSRCLPRLFSVKTLLNACKDFVYCKILSSKKLTNTLLVD